RDIAGESHPNVATYLERDDRKALGELSRARREWAALAAWPWLHFDNGRLPKQWWTLEPVRESWAAWVDPARWRAHERQRAAAFGQPN
ncbi:MAG TPA: hypothetical protein VMU39_08125, partial [Solirubrobacteraceae bacterium]|nr:hypothetical protein [Solirubrobacteraceae bacterium]